MRVYKYLEAQWAIDNLEKRRLKIPLMDDLNDPFEFLNCQMSSKEHQIAMNSAMNVISRDYGVGCFSKNCSDPLLWGHYADKHKGICLGFDITAADEVTYIHNKKLLCKEFEKEINSGFLNLKEQERIMRKLLLSKYNGWAYEDEVRVFAQVEEKGENGHFFVDFSADFILRQVIIGVRCYKEDIEKVLKNVPEQVEVILTRLDFETFKVVEDCRIK